MNGKDSQIWIWLQRGKFFKAIFDHVDSMLTIYNENDEVVMKRKNLSMEQFKKIEAIFQSNGAKRADTHNKFFIFL